MCILLFGLVYGVRLMMEWFYELVIELVFEFEKVGLLVIGFVLLVVVVCSGML